MRFHYEKADDAFYIRFEEKPYAWSDEVEKGVIFDYDKNDKLIGIEVLDASKKLSPAARASFSRERYLRRTAAKVPA